MPTKLPNGATIYNLTKHEIPFEDEKTGKVIIVPSDGVLNAEIHMEEVERYHGYRFYTSHFHKTKEGVYLLTAIRSECKEAVIVGSMAAAQAYPEDVVAQVPSHSSRLEPNKPYTARSNRFTTFKRSNNHG